MKTPWLSLVCLAALLVACDLVVVDESVKIPPMGGRDAGSTTTDCTGLTSCGGECVDLNSDRRHCGMCNRSCAECNDGMCLGLACTEPGAEVCGESCVNTQTSALHCGRCELPCDPGQTCEMGGCVGGGDVCAGLFCGVDCFSRYSVEHCGRPDEDPCGGRSCDPGEQCNGSACQPGGMGIYLDPDPLVGASLIDGDTSRYVCPGSLTEEVAQVACRAAGLTGGTVIPAIFDFEELAVGIPIRLVCTGDEPALSECSVTPDTDCVPDELFRIRCSDPSV